MASGASFTFEVDPLRSNLLAYSAKIAVAVAAVMELMASQIEEDAKANHPWQNITGNAQAGLHAGLMLEGAGFMVTLYLAHGVDYGIFLETAHGGVNAVIIPTLERYYGPIMAAITAILQ